MPLVDYDSEQTWNDLYSIRVRVDLQSQFPSAPAKGTRVGYGKWAALLMALPGDRSRLGVPVYFVRRAKWLISRLEAAGLNSSHRVLVVGSGYGYLVHGFRHAAHPSFQAAAQDYVNVWGIDGSTYIETRFPNEQLSLDGQEDSATTVHESFANTGRVRNALTTLTGDWHFDVIITEEVLESLDNTELSTLAQDCEAALSSTNFRRIIHLVNPGLVSTPAYPFQVRTLDEWHSLRDTHTFVSVIDGDFRLGVV